MRQTEPTTEASGTPRIGDHGDRGQTSDRGDESDRAGRTPLLETVGAAALIGIALAYGLVVIIRPLDTALYLDDLGTAWVVRGGWRDVAELARQYHGQTPVYYLFIWLWTQMAGSSEVALRIPSVVAMAGSVAAVASAAKTAFGRGAVPATIALLGAANVAYASTDARPYAMAVLFAALSTLFLMKWIDHGGRRNAIAYVLAATAMAYVHYVFGAVLVGQAVAYLIAAKEPRQRRAFGRAGVVIALLLLPTLGHVLSLVGRSDQLVVPSGPSVLDVVTAAVGLEMLFVIGVAGIVSRFTLGHTEPPDWSTGWTVGLSTTLVPLAILLALSPLAGMEFGWSRYQLVTAVGLALLIAGATERHLPSGAVRLAALVVLAFVGLQNGAQVVEHPSGWRDALGAIDAADGPDTLILLDAGFIEASDPAFVGDPENAEYLSSPTSYYPVDGRVAVLPHRAHVAAVEPYVAEVVTAALDHVFVVLNFYIWSEELDAQLDEALTREGFVRQDQRFYGSWTFVSEYRR